MFHLTHNLLPATRGGGCIELDFGPRLVRPMAQLVDAVHQGYRRIVDRIVTGLARAGRAVVDRIVDAPVVGIVGFGHQRKEALAVRRFDEVDHSVHDDVCEQVLGLLYEFGV